MSDPDRSSSTPTTLSRAQLLWAAAGPVLLLGSAVWRLAPRAFEAAATTSPERGIAMAVATGLMIWFEGHRGFHQRVVPQTIARIGALARAPRDWRTVVAPIAACELAFVPAERVRRRWMLVAAVVLAVVGARLLPPDLRGIVSIAVCGGLGWGLGSLLLALRVPWREGRRLAAATSHASAHHQRA